MNTRLDLKLPRFSREEKAFAEEIAFMAVSFASTSGLGFSSSYVLAAPNATPGIASKSVE